MNQLIPEATIQEAIELLKATGHPARIILLGPCARGTPREDSDLDLMVVLPVVKDRQKEMVRLRRALIPLRIPVDIIVVG